MLVVLLFNARVNIIFIHRYGIFGVIFDVQFSSKYSSFVYMTQVIVLVASDTIKKWELVLIE